MCVNSLEYIKRERFAEYRCVSRMTRTHVSLGSLVAFAANSKALATSIQVRLDHDKISTEILYTVVPLVHSTSQPSAFGVRVEV
jgi:hypothetical protein